MSSKSPLIPVSAFEFVQHINPLSHQLDPNSLCARIEKRLTDCHEAYGFGRRGKEQCKDLTYDFNECRLYTFQNLRYQAIRKERMKQYREGKLEKPFDEHPPIDGLIYY